jgi:hypothetical protein
VVVQNDRRTLLTDTESSASCLHLGIASSSSNATKKWSVGVTGDTLQVSGDRYISFYSGCLCDETYFAGLLTSKNVTHL